MNPFRPKLRGLIDARVEQEIARAFDEMYLHFQRQLEDVQRQAGQQGKVLSQVRESSLFAAGLAAPLPEPGDDISRLQSETTLEAADIPDLPASKITSGQFSLGRLDGDVLKTDDNLAITLGAFASTGKVTIKDNAGNSVEVLAV